MEGARNPELEAQILEDPEDPAAYLVYADWLQGQGDPRGKLIVAQAALARDPGSEPLAAAAAAILEEHGEALLGSLAADPVFRADWHCGFWHTAHVGGWHGDRPAPGDHVARVVASPSARFLRRMRYSGPLAPRVLGALAPLARTLRDLEASVGHHQVEDEHLRELAPLARLRRLALYSCELVTARGMQALSSLEHLEALDLRNCPLSDDRAYCLVGLPLARVMFNAVTPAFTAAGMTMLATGPLRALHLDGDTIDDADVAPLADHPTLADLELGGARITARGAAALASLARLHRLYLPDSTLDDRGVRELAPLAGRLKVLYLGHAQGLTDASCEILSAFDQLVFLDLAASRIGRAGIRALSRLPRLERLDLGRLGIDDEDLRELAPLASLRELSLFNCQRLTDRAIDTLAQLPLLERLDLSGSQITGSGIARLAEMPHLRELGLTFCDDAVIERARQVERWYVNTRDFIELWDSLGEPP